MWRRAVKRRHLDMAWCSTHGHRADVFTCKRPKVNPVKNSITEWGGALETSPLFEELMKIDNCQAGMGRSLFFCGLNTNRSFMPHWMTPHPCSASTRPTGLFVKKKRAWYRLGDVLWGSWMELGGWKWGGHDDQVSLFTCIQCIHVLHSGRFKKYTKIKEGEKDVVF